MVTVDCGSLYFINYLQVESFFCGKVDATALQTLDRPFRQVAEHIRNNNKVLKNVKEPVHQYLQERSF